MIYIESSICAYFECKFLSLFPICTPAKSNSTWCVARVNKAKALFATLDTYLKIYSAHTYTNTLLAIPIWGRPDWPRASQLRESRSRVRRHWTMHIVVVAYIEHRRAKRSKLPVSYFASALLSIVGCEIIFTNFEPILCVFLVVRYTLTIFSIPINLFNLDINQLSSMMPINYIMLSKTCDVYGRYTRGSENPNRDAILPIDAATAAGE